MRKLIPFFVIYINCIFSFSQTQPTSISSLKLIGNYEIPFNKKFKNTAVGGLSGIDYDAVNRLYYIISDDRSAKSSARFYSAKIHLSEKGIDSVELLDVNILLQPDGKPFPGAKETPRLTPDPESIRYNPINNELIWSSEGERTIHANDTILQHPSIQIIGTDGSFKSSFTMPTNLEMHSIELGARQNGTFEGIAFSHDFNYLYACLEEPLYQDGPKANVQETNSFVRIYKFDSKKRTVSEEYAYKLEKVAYSSIPSNAFKVNGVSEIVSFEKDKLLLVERSFSTGRLACTVRLFLADLSQAENIIHNYSLIKTPPKKTVAKKLLLNMDDLGIFIDNIEGLTFGPTLTNGHKTLIFIADNNFQSSEKNQFLLFEVMP